MQLERNEMAIAWAAGLFEGEGCWNAYVRKSGKVQMQARLAMTDRDVVERFAAIIGFGSVYERSHQKHEEWKPLFDWSIYEAEKVRELVALFLPYMGERRRAKALEVLTLGADVKSHNAKKTHCPKGHALAGENLVLEPIKRNGREYFARRCLTCRRAQDRERTRKRLGITPDRYRVTT
jgi:hypothetical protein